MTKYSEKTAEKILEEIAIGKSLISVCKKLKIGYSTVTQWLRENSQFSANYARAREDQADYLAEIIIDISDNEKLTPEARRIRIDSRKWYAGKIRPKKYGDKQGLEISGHMTLAQLVEASMKPGL